MYMLDWNVALSMTNSARPTTADIFRAALAPAGCPQSPRRQAAVACCITSAVNGQNLNLNRNPPSLQYLSSRERSAVAAEVGPGGQLRYIGSGQPVHTLSPDDAAELEADSEAWRTAEQAAAAMARGGDKDATEVRPFLNLLFFLSPSPILLESTGRRAGLQSTPQQQCRAAASCTPQRWVFNRFPYLTFRTFLYLTHLLYWVPVPPFARCNDAAGHTGDARHEGGKELLCGLSCWIQMLCGLRCCVDADVVWTQLLCGINCVRKEGTWQRWWPLAAPKRVACIRGPQSCRSGRQHTQPSGKAQLVALYYAHRRRRLRPRSGETPTSGSLSRPPT